MRNVFIAAAVVAAIAVPVLAQNTPPGPPSPTVAGPNAAIPAAPGQPSVAVSPTVPGSILAPNRVDAAAPVTDKPLVPPAMQKLSPGAPVAGANSFTESQAKARIEARGFSNVTALKKDDSSIWRGKAMKDGKSVSVALDYQGNVVAD